MERLLEIMRRLRAPDGCPWDREQTHESLRPYLLEEAAEAVDALASGVTDDVVEELGDVLLQVAFHAVIAEQEGAFAYQDVEEAIVAKLIRRHPHVFAETRVADAGEVLRNWQELKKQEKPIRPGGEVPRSLPALMRASELGRKLDWAAAQRDPWPELSRALQDSRSLGAILLHIAVAAGRKGLDPELALRDAIESKLRGESAS